MSAIPPKTDFAALGLFQSRDAKRTEQKNKGEKVDTRILLSIVGEGKDRHLEAKEDGFVERIKILISKITPSFFSTRSYKLEDIQNFVTDTYKSKKGKEYALLLAGKITSRNLKVKPSLGQLFNRIFSRTDSTLLNPPNRRLSGFGETKPAEPISTQTTNQAKKPTEKVDKLTDFINTLLILPLTSEEIKACETRLDHLASKLGNARADDIATAKSILAEKKKEVEENPIDITKIPAGANYGITNPGTACFLSATLQGIGKSRAFHALLEKRANNLDEILEGYVRLPQTRSDLVNQLAKTLYSCENVREAEKIVDAIKEDVDVADLPEHLEAIAALPPEAREALLQLTLVNKLQDIFEKMKTGTVDEDTIQTLRTIIICSGFEKGDADLYSQEDAGHLCVRLLDILESPLFHYKIAIDYPASFPISTLDRQEDNANIHYVQVVNAKEKTSIQALVTDVRVEEEVDKKALLGADNIKFTHEQFQEIEKLPNISKIATVQSLLLTKGNEPAILPIILKRYNAKGIKVNTSIIPSYSIDIPLTGKDTEQARYRLVGVAVHHGASVRSGHFYTYVPKIEGNDISWTCYNDSRVSTPSNNDAEEDVATHGYVYYYEFIGNVEMGTPPLASA